MKILAIETSCDETAMAFVEATGVLKHPRFKVLENIVSSQIKIHRPFGGVVPNLAKREHIKNLPKIFKTLVARRKSLAPDFITVTVGPGLEPALWAGIEFAKALHTNVQSANRKARIALIGANHMEGHLYSNWLSPVGIKSKAQIPNAKSFPAIALVVSGGHTILLKMGSLTKWKKLGETRDDAAGEAFDKVAKMMGLPYPGGPEIQKLAEKGNPNAIPFPRPMLKAAKPPKVLSGAKDYRFDYEFSFSGLKTSVLYYLRDNPKAKKADVAASFQQAVLDVLIGKTIRAAREFGAKSILLSGGVAANKALRESLAFSAKRLAISFFVPPFEYNTDNAVMIAVAAYIRLLAKKKPYQLTAQSNLNL